MIDAITNPSPSPHKKTNNPSSSNEDVDASVNKLGRYFEEMRRQEWKYEHRKEFRSQIREFSPHPLRHMVCEWIKNSEFDLTDLTVSKKVELASRFLASPQEKIESFCYDPEFQELWGKRKAEAAYLLLEKEDHLQHKKRILEFFKAITYAKKSENIDGYWTSNLYYKQDFGVPFSRIMEWHECIKTAEFTEEESLALFNKLCSFVERGGKEIAEELMSFILSFDSITRLGVVTILLVKEKKRLDILKISRLLIPKNAHPRTAAGIISSLDQSPKSERKNSFQVLRQLIELCASCEDAELMKKMCALSDKQAHVALFNTLSTKILSNKQMNDLLTKLTEFKWKEKAIYFKAIEKWVVDEINEEVQHVKEVFRTAGFKLTDSQEFRAACLFLTDKELLRYNKEILFFIAAASPDKGDPDIRRWVKKLSYNPTCPVDFSQLLSWHQRLTTAHSCNAGFVNKDNLSPEHSLALFNKLCRFVDKGEREISNQLFEFILSFPLSSRVAAADILLTRKEERVDISDKCLSLLSVDAHSCAITETIDHMNSLSRSKRQKNFEQIRSLANFSTPDKDYCRVLKHIYRLSQEEKFKYAELSKSYICRKIPSVDLDEIFRKMYLFDEKGRAAFFPGVVRLVLRSESEKVSWLKNEIDYSVEQIAKKLPQSKENHKKKTELTYSETFQAACLFLTNEKLLLHKDEILTLFLGLDEDKFRDFLYHPGLSVPFDQILRWWQTIQPADFGHKRLSVSKPKNALQLFNILCGFVESGGKAISNDVLDFLHSFKPLARTGAAEILLVSERDRSDVMQKSQSLARSNCDPKVLAGLIKVLAKLSVDERKAGYQEAVALSQYCELDGEFPSVLSNIYALPSEKRLALIDYLKSTPHVLTGTKMDQFLRLLSYFEASSKFDEIENLLPDEWCMYDLDQAFQRLCFQGTSSPATVTTRMQEFLTYFKSDLNRALLVRICTRQRWMDGLRSLIEHIENEPDEDRRGLILLLAFLPENKRILFLELFKDNQSENLEFASIVDFFLNIPENDRKHSFLSICCKRLYRFTDEWIYSLESLFWWLPQDKYTAFFDFFRSLDSPGREHLQLYCFRSPVAPSIIPHLQQLFSKPLFPSDKTELSDLIVEHRFALGITTEHPLVQEAIRNNQYERTHDNYQSYLAILERQQTTPPIKLRMKAVNIHNQEVAWDQSRLQTSFCKPYTYGDLPSNVSSKAFEQLYCGYPQNEPWYGPLSIYSPYPALIALKGTAAQPIPTAKFYLDTLLRHFDDADVKEMVAWCLYRLDLAWHGINKTKRALKKMYRAYEERLSKNNENLIKTVIGYEHALGCCYYSLPVHQRVHDSILDANSSFILNCFKTSVQKVFYQTFVKLAEKERIGDSRDGYIVTLQNMLSRHVGFPHLPTCPDDWNDHEPIIYRDDKTEEQLVEAFFLQATPDKAVKEIIADSRVLIEKGYGLHLEKALGIAENDRSCFNTTGTSLSEAGAIRILQKLGIVTTSPDKSNGIAF